MRLPGLPQTALVCLLVVGAAVATRVALRPPPPPVASNGPPKLGEGGRAPAAPIRQRPSGTQAIREQLFAELQPVRLANCTLERFGEKNDGGYLMCANLLKATAGYSYGISNYDGWGCGVSIRLGVPVHQYDCFDQRAPACAGGQTRFHPECIAASSSVDAAGRRFDSLPSQLSRNGDARRHVVVKMDVEGAEWDSLLATPPDVLDQIDQLTIEMHDLSADDWTQHLVVAKLRDHFHVAHLHFNNFACRPGREPFPSWAWEVLLVNKRIATVAADQSPLVRPHPLDAPNNPKAPDCPYAQGDRAAPTR